MLTGVQIHGDDGACLPARMISPTPDSFILKILRGITFPAATTARISQVLQR
jgi:hypothetical protein